MLHRNLFFTSSYFTISYAALPNLHTLLQYLTHVFILLHHVFLSMTFFTTFNIAVNVVLLRYFIQDIL